MVVVICEMTYQWMLERHKLKMTYFFQYFAQKYNNFQQYFLFLMNIFTTISNNVYRKCLLNSKHLFPEMLRHQNFRVFLHEY